MSASAIKTLDDKTINIWKSTIKKKDTFNVKDIDYSGIFETPIYEILKDLFVSRTDKKWTFIFPKILVSEVDTQKFVCNLSKEINLFFNTHLPLTKKDIPVGMNCIQMYIEKTNNWYIPQGFLYPDMFCYPSFFGLSEDLNKFNDNAPRELYWSGNFIKNKTTNKIENIHLKNLYIVNNVLGIQVRIDLL